MKHMFYICLIVAASLTVIAADPVDDAKAIQGSWVPVKGVLGGKPMPEVVLKGINLKLKDGKYDVVSDGHPDKGTYTIEATSRPKGMTVIGTEGPNAGKTFPAIYEVKGDMLCICYDLSGVKRPAEFKSVAGTMLYLVTYTRKKD